LKTERDVFKLSIGQLLDDRGSFLCLSALES